MRTLPDLNGVGRTHTELAAACNCAGLAWIAHLLLRYLHSKAIMGVTAAAAAVHAPTTMVQTELPCVSTGFFVASYNGVNRPLLHLQHPRIESAYSFPPVQTPHTSSLQWWCTWGRTQTTVRL